MIARWYSRSALSSRAFSSGFPLGFAPLRLAPLHLLSPPTDHDSLVGLTALG
jgi:hypothetical protein